MILITGASGKTGRAITRSLSLKGVNIRALVRNEIQGNDLLSVGAGEFRCGDLRDYDFLASSMQGISTIYYICPNVAPDEVQIGDNLITLARQNKVTRFGYHSVLHPQIKAMPHHWNKMKMEEKIFSSGMDFVILQPCAYMQNILANWSQIAENGVYEVPYTTSSRISIVDLDEIAEAAATILTDVGYNNAVFELAGPQPISQDEIAIILGKHLRKPVKSKTIDRELWAANAKTSGLGEFQIGVLLKMFRYYEKSGLIGNDTVLNHILGRNARTFEEFLIKYMQSTSQNATGGNRQNG